MANEQGGGVSSFSMAAPHKVFARFFSSLKSCIPWRSEPPNVSRDFWMPDGSCRVCYECDAQFTVFFRKHHCRLCGRIFCARCTEHSIPAPTVDGVERESVRVCNFCYKQHEKGIAFTHENGTQIANADNISTSPTETSFTSFKSCGTANSSNFTLNSVPYSTGQYQRLQNSSGLSPCHSLGTRAEKENKYAAWRTNGFVADLAVSPNHYENSISRSDDEDVSYGTYQSNSMNSHQANDYYEHVGFYCMSNHDESHQVEKLEMDGGNIDANHLSSSPVLHSFDSQVLDEVPPLEKKEDEHDMVDEFASSLYSTGDVGLESGDFEKNALLWLPPEPEDEEDERESDLLDDDGDVAGEWGTSLPSRSFGSGESHSRDRSGEEHTKVMKNVVDGHFRALLSQLLLVENLPVGQEGENENWLEIITYLSWEAATLLKPDMSKGGGMDPGGYVKVKCIASGRPSESMVIKGVVCKKNVAHRRMTSKIEKPRFMILGGALEYQRVSNLLSSFDTLLQQEMDHLKMAVAKIEAHHPDVLLVEKSVSRYAQDYLLAKDISLVLNIKRSILERISRCTGAQIVPSIDRLSSQELGYCDTFHVERFLEDLDSAGQGEKKLVKTLMFFEGCPKPLGCTILLRGACRDELKKVKHVIQYGIFAAYHLALETSFLADEGASLPELPFQSSIAVALPDKLPSSFERSISMVPGFKIDANGASQGTPHQSTPIRSISVPVSDFESAINSRPSCILNSLSSLPIHLTSSSTGSTGLQSAAPGDSVSFHIGDNQNEMDSKDSWVEEMSAFRADSDIISNHVTANNTRCTETMGQDALSDTQNEASGNKPGSSDNPIMHQDSQTHAAHSGTMNDEFPPSPADHQSILVSLSSRCVWKGTVCERSHRFRIKYYGSFDKPLGRFLRDHLFDQTYQCKSCEMPSEAHVHCYTHRQGTLTISVKRLPEIFLPGEREGKIWMWHRCLRCPRIGGFPPATQRIVMSDAAWGLSFGKFLELSFSNHAAASRVASCGHSLHRDCLRFYGFGKMVACFRYASIDIHSVYLPPSKLDFISTKQEWIQIETSEVVDRAELLFSEVLNALCQIEEKAGSGSITSGNLTVESRHQIVELEAMLQKEKVEFQELLQKTLTREPKKGQPVIDILEINRLRRQLFFQSYMWDHRLVYAASLDKNSFRDSSVNSFQGSLSSSTPTEAKPMTNNEKLAEIDLNPGKVYNSRDSYLMDALCDGFDHKSGSSSPGMNADMVHVAHLNTSNDCDEFDRKGGLSSPGINADMVHAAQLNMRNDLDDFDHKGVSNPGISSDMVQVAHLNTRNELKKEEGHANIPPNTSVGAQSVPLTPRASHHRVRSDGQLLMVNLSDTLETAWTGENLVNGAIPKERACLVPDTAVETSSNASRNGTKISPHGSAALSSKGSDNVEDKVRWLKMPFLNFYRSLNTSFLSSAQKFDTLGEYNPVYVSSFRELELEGGARLLLPVGDNDIVIPVYDDEPTSLIAYALSSSDYKLQTRDDEGRGKENGDVMATMSFTDSVIMRPDDDTASETHNRSLGSPEESVLSVSGSRDSMGLDPLSYTKSLHARVSFGDDGPLGKVKYSVTCYYAKCFEGLRKMCCPSELDFVRSLSRCKKWGAEGGKSNVFFAKTLDDRFIIKQVTKTELESFIKFAPAYFKYVSHSISTGGPTCLAKILGIYQFTAKHVKGGKETKMDVLIMENLLFGRTVTRVYDLKGSSRSRYNPDSSGSNKVLLDQNLIETMPTSPIFVGNKAKRLLERAVWNDTAFLASVDVMDYSLLVGVDEEKHELVLGIIDFMRQYTWDKHLETWVKASGILGGPKNTSPTVISPKQYKKRFRKAMSTYFLMVLDQWSPSSNIPSSSQSDFGEEAASGGASVE